MRAATSTSVIQRTIAFGKCPPRESSAPSRAQDASAGYPGDSGPAITARLNEPDAIAVDATGNLYIADSPNGRIRKVSAAGIINTVAGNGSTGYSGDGGPATDAHLSRPRGVA